MNRILRHLLSENAPKRITNGVEYIELSGGWLHSNGNVAKRVKSAPKATVEMLREENAGSEISPELGAPDHCLDRSSDAVPHVVRTAEYRLIAIGLASSGRPLTQTGVAHVRHGVRFLACPSKPTSLWRIDVLSRLRQGPGLIAHENTHGQFKTVAKPQVRA